MGVTRVAYEADGWGVGELWLDGETLLWHELPTGTGTAGACPSSELAERFQSYFAGERPDLSDVRLDLEDYTPFQLAVVEALRGVAYGEVVTYGELAALAGRPRAARAAGTFCARCKLAPFLPVHRVVASDGIGSWGSHGVEVKRKLLELEGVAFE